MGLPAAYSGGVSSPGFLRHRALGLALLGLALVLFAFGVRADPATDPLSAQVKQWAQAQAQGGPTRPGARVDVEVGSLDPRLRLAPSLVRASRCP